MPEKKDTSYISTGINLERDVLEFVDGLAEEDERSRSYIINRIIREYAKQKGAKLLPPERPQNALRRSKEP